MRAAVNSPVFNVRLAIGCAVHHTLDFFFAVLVAFAACALRFGKRNTGGFEWTTHTLVNGDAKTNIARITFNLATRGIFAIDDLLFTEAGTGGGGGNVPEPAGLGLVALALAAAGVASRRSKPA